jgi:hypothetical protein
VLGTEIRYVRSKSTNPWKRMGNAVVWQFMTYNSAGHYVFDLPSVSATYLQEIIGVQWVPGRTVTGYGLRSANQQMVQGIAVNMLREFLPDIKRAFRRKPPVAAPPPPAAPQPPPPDGH